MNMYDKMLRITKAARADLKANRDPCGMARILRNMEARAFRGFYNVKIRLPRALSQADLRWLKDEGFDVKPARVGYCLPYGYVISWSERGECGTCGYAPCACDQQ